MTAAAVIFAAMYTPYLWLLLIDYPWNTYQWFWVRSWFALPFFIPARLVGWRDVDSPVAVVSLSALGLLLVCGLTLLGARGRWTLVQISAAVLLLSSLNSFGLYHAFRA